MGIKLLSSNKFYIDARIWYKGKEFRKREEFDGGKKAAEDRHYSLKKELRKEAESELCSLKIQTFGDALEYYYALKKDALVSPTAFDRMKKELCGVKISEIQERFRIYWNILRRTTSKQTGELLANSTINHYTVMAKAALNMCVRDGLIERNPLEHIEILKTVPRDVVLSDGDRIELLKVIDAEAPHLSQIVRFALAVPSRKSELVNLRVEDLDLFNMCVRVRHENAKGNRGSWKPIPEELHDYFRQLRPDTEFLFYRVVNGCPVSLGNFKKSFARCLKLAKIEDWHFHDFRHFSATELLNAGNPEQVVSQIAGWTSGNMIKQYYHRDGMKAAKDVVFPSTKTGHHTGHLGVVNQ